MAIFVALGQEKDNNKLSQRGVNWTTYWGSMLSLMFPWDFFYIKDFKILNCALLHLYYYLLTIVSTNVCWVNTVL